MDISLFEQLGDIFASSKGLHIHVNSVPAVNLLTFNRNKYKLFKLVGENGNDDFWSPIIRDVKRFCFNLSAAPLSMKFVKEMADSLYLQLSSKVEQCGIVYGDEFSIALSQIADQAQWFSINGESNLLEFLSNLGNDRKVKNQAIVICAQRLIPLVVESIKTIEVLNQASVISPSDLRDNNCYSIMYVVGAPRWFPEFVFSSPRSKDIEIVKHKWITGNWSPNLVFISPYKPRGKQTNVFNIVDEDSDFFIENPEELIPQIDIRRIIDTATNQLYDLVSDEDEIVVARLFILENNWAVFLDAEDDASVDIIDLDEDAKKRVRRSDVKDLHPGMFILLRTEGGGDYIVPVANQILGKIKDKARADQRKWKTLLREYVNKNGEKKTIKYLHELGSLRAAGMNLKHWMSFRGIKTESYDDFLAIMRLIGLETEAGNYWETMTNIRNAHMKAGFTIRAMLLDLVNRSDLTALKNLGEMNFELSAQGAGKLCAFRVIEVTKETIEVIHWRIGEPFRTDNG